LQLCDSLVFAPKLNNASCSAVNAAEAGHNRDAAAVPTLLYKGGVVTRDVFSMCQEDQAATSRGACAAGQTIVNAYAVRAWGGAGWLGVGAQVFFDALAAHISVRILRHKITPPPPNPTHARGQVYGGAVPASKKVQLSSFPMLSQTQLQSASAQLGWSAYNASRMNTRYLAQAQSLTLSWGKKQTQTVTFTGYNGVANLDTGAFSALSVGAAAFSAFESAVASQVAALQADARNKQYNLQPCTADLMKLCGGNSNTVRVLFNQTACVSSAVQPTT
jgi:hypothetical protein